MARKRRIFVLPGAAADLQAIYDPLFSEVIRRIRLLAEFPEMGAPLAGPMSGWRATTVDILRIFYRLKGRGIEIGYVRHCKREFPHAS